MIRFITPSAMPTHDIEKLARAFARADNMNPDIYALSFDTDNAYTFGQHRTVPGWQTYIPKVLEFLQMKRIHDDVFPAPIQPSHMTQLMPVSEVRLPARPETFEDMNAEQIFNFKQRALDEARDPAIFEIPVDTVRQLAKNHAVKKYKLRSCSICETPLYYSIEGENVTFQPSCECSRFAGQPEQCSFADIARCFNIQTDSSIRARMLSQFIESGERP